MKPLVEFKNFSFQYFEQSEPTLHDINLVIHEGEKVLIAGPSGSGKSTIGNCINGLIPFAHKGTIEGSLSVCGIETKSSSLFELSTKVGTVLQDSDGQFIGLNVGEDIAFALENNIVSQEEMFQRVNELADIIDMQEHIKQNPHDLSGGQKQRVSLAGVMVEDVDILLFDEPLANLDPKTGKVAIELIDDISKKDKTVVIIEHRIEDVLHRPVDRIILVDDGRIIMDDTPDRVLASGILISYGVREPLYLTCARYAGVNITEDYRPASIDTFRVDKCKSELKKWYDANLVRESKEPQKELLTIENIQFSYDGVRPILKEISATIYEGEMLALVGRNGAGKTTLANILCGFITADAGRVVMGAEDLSKYSISERAEHIGIVMQNPNQMISKTMIFDEVAFGLKIRNVPDAEIEERVNEVLKICGIYEFRKWPIAALSYGQKKRVTIASILVLNPKILILDEPTAGQDYKHYSDIMAFLKTLNENGQTILLITHDMHLMLEYTKRAIVITDGVKLADEKSFEVLCNLDLTDRANLKETSLFALAQKAEIEEPLGFVESFIHYDREVRKNEN